MKKKDNESKEIDAEQKYFRIINLMKRYNFSRGHITNLINSGKLPQIQECRALD